MESMAGSRQQEAELATEELERVGAARVASGGRGFAAACGVCMHTVGQGRGLLSCCLTHTSVWLCGLHANPSLILVPVLTCCCGCPRGCGHFILVISSLRSPHEGLPSPHPQDCLNRLPFFLASQ